MYQGTEHDYLDDSNNGLTFELHRVKMNTNV